MLDSRPAFTSAVVSFTLAEALERLRREVKTIKKIAGNIIKTIIASSHLIVRRRIKEPIRFSMAIEKSSGP